MPRTLHRDAAGRLTVWTSTGDLERPLATVVDAAFQFIGVLAPDGTLLDANRSSLAVVGATLDEVVGRPFWDTPWWASAESRAWVRGAVADAAAGAKVRGEVQHVAADGRPVFVDFSLTPLLDESACVRALLAEGRDVTERKHLEDALRQSERRAAFLANASEVLGSSLDFDVTFDRLASLIVPSIATFCVVDLLTERGTVERKRVLHAREAMRAQARLLETYPRVQQHLYLTSETIRRGRPRLVSHVDDAYLVRMSEDESHLAVLRALAPRSFMAAPLIARGRILGAVAFCRDASAPPYEQGDLAMAEDFTHRAALALDNARLYETSRKATRARDEMLGLVSHDLRNPLSAISMCVAGLLEQPDMDRERTVHLLQSIRDAADLSHRLIEDLLDGSAIEAGRLTIERRPVDPVVIAAQAAELFETTAVHQGITLDLDVPEFLPRVNADAERLVQALANLVGNALKFTPSGGRVAIHGGADDTHAILAVTDTGPGVPPEDAPFIFDRYWHAQRSAKARGTGLGLAIVKAIVTAHGGRVWVDGNPAGGSRFTIALPRV